MWLYRARLLKLEKEFENARRIIKELEKFLAEASTENLGDPKGSGRAEVKLRLDVAIGLVRLVKEQVAFYLKLGEKYDAIQLAEMLVEELKRRDEPLCREILGAIDARLESDFGKG